MGQALQRALPTGVLPVLAVDRHDQLPSEADRAMTGAPVGVEDGAAEDVTGEKFPDLSCLPPEVALTILSNLGATDLCLAGCVWQQLATDNILWQGLCRYAPCMRACR